MVTVWGSIPCPPTMPNNGQNITVKGLDMTTYEQIEKATGLAFPCECGGCRDRSANLSDIYDASQIPAKVQGYYFSDSTRRFFSSRILSFRHLAGGSLAVRESLAGDMHNSTRAHRVTVWCRYGHILPRDIAGDTYNTGTKAAAAMRALDDEAATACECHGCQLDKVGR
jgi:hypothetical protein